MAPAPSPDPKLSDAEVATLLAQLRRKEGSWVDWGQTCQALQKSGLTPQQIFEATGFEPIHQNQISVATQVYDSMVAAGVDEAVRSHFQQRGSDSLYELRVLSQTDRVKVARLILRQGLTSEQVKEVVKPVKEFSYRQDPPAGFSDDPGDAVAYHYWNLARQQSDLQARSRLIAQALRFVHSDQARRLIESLLSDFTVVKAQTAPSLPVFRLENETELPRIIPVAGPLPLGVEDLKAVPVTLAEEPFGLVSFSGTGAWVAVPGWQVILQAEDPVALLAGFNQLPNVSADTPQETVLVIIDRRQRGWDGQAYFAADQDGQVVIRWFAETPTVKLLGRLILVVRPKRILDDSYTKELWQIEE
ncbi:uncharacterized protein XM38_021290 [Halomicronema hongdechloris C2206]|uniref:RuBisCO accumulation factor 1 n=1 Tax=Halomicronema hongdechloris C2206 TaxID=1641165 RepID=A0A1Z3HLK8_9CYAN|nr:RuBisCO accumulation factor 1 [Halomicronema hongdechloris]ASC71178.1 uncharacterized protein XM38_021290 [Halomicronema hongdechloris C2206]